MSTSDESPVTGAPSQATAEEELNLNLQGAFDAVAGQGRPLSPRQAAIVEAITVKSGSATSALSPKAVGDHVEANYHGEGRYHAGRIDTIDEDGSYAIRYFDGDFEDGVSRDQLRGLQKR